MVSYKIIRKTLLNSSLNSKQLKYFYIKVNVTPFEVFPRNGKIHDQGNLRNTHRLTTAYRRPAMNCIYHDYISQYPLLRWLIYSILSRAKYSGKYVSF